MIDPMHFDFAGTAQKLRDIRDLGGEVVITFSILANFAPKAERFTSRFVRNIVAKYNTFVSFCALNWRSHLRKRDTPHD